MKPVNVSIDLCRLLNGALCPLPMYNFTGSDTLTLPASLGVPKRIPSIAFWIPDLEAYAQVTLIELGTGSIKACVQATLSNGWSTSQPAVEIITGIFAFLALLLALWQTLPSPAPTETTTTTLLPAPIRLLDLLSLFQSIVTSALLNLNYPSVYRSFALNFAWSMGLLFTSSQPSSVQAAINHMRHLTGGDMPDADGSAVGLVNRKLSPYNDAYVVPKSLLAAPSLGMTLASGNGTNLGDVMTREVVTVTSSSANVLQAGIPIYVNSLNIAAANAFMTVFISALIFAAIALTVFALGYFAILAMHRYGWGTEEWRVSLRNAYPDFVRAWTLRLVSSGQTPRPQQC
jgi:Transient receptor potential (TRP) ion channel/ML-like domain